MSLLDSLVAWSIPLTPRFVVGKVARRYIAGETLDEAVETIQALNEAGARATVDVLGEFIHRFEEAEATSRQYEAIQGAIAEHGLDSNVSVKLTALGLLIDETRCTELVRQIAQRAADRNSFVRIDMEDSPVTQRTLDLVRRLHGEGLPVGAVLQAYLHRTVDDAAALGEEGISVRLCKGIYRESETIAYQGREEIRQSFRNALAALLRGKGGIGIATHDEVLVGDARKQLRAMRPAPERYEFQMLLGVRAWMRDELLAAGEQVRIYVPFGTAWYGYATRRLRENPQIAGHVFKALLRLDRGKKNGLMSS